MHKYHCYSFPRIQIDEIRKFFLEISSISVVKYEIKLDELVYIALALAMDTTAFRLFFARQIRWKKCLKNKSWVFCFNN